MSKTKVITPEVAKGMSTEELNAVISTSDDQTQIAAAEAEIARRSAPTGKPRAKKFITGEIIDVEKHSEHELYFVTIEDTDGEQQVVSYGANSPNAPYNRRKGVLQPGINVVAEVEVRIEDKTTYEDRNGETQTDASSGLSGTFNVKRESAAAAKRRLLAEAKDEILANDAEYAGALASLYGAALGNSRR